MYNKNKPFSIIPNNFSENVSPYGSHYASYPFSLRLAKFEILKEIVSG